MLNKSDILNATDLNVRELSVPEWNGTVFIRVMTGAERDAFEAGTNNNGKANLRDIRARFAAIVLCDETGARIFSDADVAALTGKSAAALDRIFDAGMALNRMTADAVDALEKN